jgi:hypothetical protein
LVKKYTNSRDSLQKQYDLINLELQNTDKPWNAYFLFFLPFA